MKKIILAILLVMSVTVTSFAQIDITKEVRDDQVTIIGNTNYVEKPVSIQVLDENRRYYINQSNTDKNGDFKYSFKLYKGKEYDGRVNVNGEKKEFHLSLANEKVEQIASIYIKGDKGDILSKTEEKLIKNETILGFTKRILDSKKIKYEEKNGYISSINGLAEINKDINKKKWNCRVNGKKLSIDQYRGRINNTDKIEWVYTDESSEEIPIVEEIASIYIKGYNGVILRKTKVKIDEDENVLELTKRILDSKGIKYEDNRGYFASIDGQAEFDKGAKSGWHYYIDGKKPDVGAGSVKVRDGYDIEWMYTFDYTKEVVIEENVDDAISNEEYKDAYSKIIDKNSDEKDILKATKQVSDKLSRKVDSINSEKEAKELVDDIEDISKIIKIAYSKTNSQEGYDDVSQKAAKLTDDTVKLYKKISDKDKKEKVYKLLGENIGITIKIIDDIEDEEKSEKICEDIIKSSLQIENKIPVYFESNKDEVEVKVPSVLMKKSIENNIDKIDITSDITSFSINPNTFNKEKNITLTAKKLKGSDLSKKQSNRVPDDSIVIDFKANDGKEDITEFKYPIEVSIPYEKSVNNKELVTAFYIKEDGNLDPMGGVYNEKTKTVKLITNHFSKYFAKEYTKEFKDLDNVKWAKDSVQIMASKGIINGKEYNTFSPNDTITRAEFAALITRMLKYKDGNDEVSFEDINKSEWYYDSINAAYQNKIINGKSESIFDPNGNITRQEMAKIIANVLEERGYKKGDYNNLNRFKDKNDIAPWAKESVGLSVKEGVITGMDNETFAPNEKATRAQSAVMLHRLYKLIID